MFQSPDEILRTLFTKFSVSDVCMSIDNLMKSEGDTLCGIDNTDLHAAINAQKKYMVELQSINEENEGAIKVLENRVKVSSVVRREYASRILDEQESIKEMKDQLLVIKKEKIRGTAMYLRLSDDVEGINTQTSSLQADIKKAAITLKARSKQFSESRNKIIKLEESTMVIETKVNMVKMNLASYTKELEVTLNEVVTVKKKIGVVRQKALVLKEEVVLAHQDAAAAKEDLGVALKEASVAKEELRLALQEASVVNEELGEALQEASGVKAELGVALNEVLGSKAELGATRNEASIINARIRVSLAEVAASKAELGDMLHQASLMKEKIRVSIHDSEERLVEGSRKLKSVMGSIIRTDKDLLRSQLILSKLFREMADTQADVVMIRRKEQSMRDNILQLAISSM
jgi:hypothetical protein